MAIKKIAEDSKNLTPVIEYLEQAYLTAPDQAAQEQVEAQVGAVALMPSLPLLKKVILLRGI